MPVDIVSEGRWNVHESATKDRGRGGESGSTLASAAARARRRGHRCGDGVPCVRIAAACVALHERRDTGGRAQDVPATGVAQPAVSVAWNQPLPAATVAPLGYAVAGGAVALSVMGVAVGV